MVIDEKEKIELYLKGYEEGQKDAWTDIESLVSKHEGWELKSRIESRIGTLYQQVNSKREELKEHPEKLSLEEEEDSPEGSETIDVPWNVGGSYLFLEEKPKKSIRELVEIVKKEVSVLFILSEPPHKRLESYDASFENCEFVMLSRERSGTEPIDGIEVKRNSPDDLNNLSAVIGKFFRSKDKPVVFLSGIPFLSNYNEEEDILKLLNFTKEKLNDHDGCLAASLSADAVEKNFLGKFKNKFDQVY